MLGSGNGLLCMCGGAGSLSVIKSVSGLNFSAAGRGKGPGLRGSFNSIIHSWNHVLLDDTTCLGQHDKKRPVATQRNTSEPAEMEGQELGTVVEPAIVDPAQTPC